MAVMRIAGRLVFASLVLAGFPAAAAPGRQAPPAPSNTIAAVPVAPPLPDAEIEQFLKEAKFVRARDTKKGVTGSLQASFTDGTRTHDVHIQTIDESKREFRSQQGVEFDFRDSWMFNIAAYKIDRLIGLNMVPVSVPRHHRSTPAAFTWWVDDVLMDEGDRLKKKIEAPDRRQWSTQTVMMRLFDELIANIDRNMGNILYARDWRLWAIDHTRAFRKNSSLKRPSHVTRCDRVVFERLKALDRDTLRREVGKFLDDGQIKALLARRDQIVKKLEDLGPSALFDRDIRPATQP